MSPPTSLPSPILRRNRTSLVRRLLELTLVLMLLQGAFGIYLNLFVTLPTPSDPNAVFPIIFSTPILAVHFVNALLLTALAGAILGFAGATRVPWLRLYAGLLVLTFVVASYSGYHFTGSENNIYSFSMEMGFLAAVALVVILIRQLSNATLMLPSDTVRPAPELRPLDPEASSGEMQVT